MSEYPPHYHPGQHTEPPTSYNLPPEKAEEVLAPTIKVIREKLGVVSGNFRENASPKQLVFETIAWTGACGALTAATFKKTFAKPLRIVAGIAAGYSALSAGISGALYYGSRAYTRDLTEVKNFLDDLDGDPDLRAQMKAKLCEHTPHNISSDGKVHFNTIVTGNEVLNWGRESGRLSPRNRVEMLSLSFEAKGDERMVGLIGGLGR